MSMRRTPLGLAVLAGLVLLPAFRASADVAATGSFDITLTLTPPNVPFTGTITFDAGTQTALGRSVDMAGDVGNMSFGGDAVVNLATESATFDLTAESAGDFAFDAAGAGSCENSGCVNGRGTFAGRITAIDDPDDVLADGSYTFDGTAEIDFQGQGPGGIFAINAFPIIPTSAGSGVQVSSGQQTFFDTVQDKSRSFVATALFDNVSAEGSTEFVAFSALPGAPPSGVNLNPVAVMYVDVLTTATVTGGVHLCLSYPDEDGNGIVDGTTNLTVPRLRLLWAATIGDALTDITVSAGDLKVCGDAPSDGLMVLGALPPGATTTILSTTTSTSVPAESTTTTSTSVPAESTTTTSTSVPAESTTTTSTSVPSESTTTTSTTVPTGESTTTTSTSIPLETSTSTSTSLPPIGTTTSTAPAPVSTTSTVVVSPSTTSTTLPSCATALECLDDAIADPLCPGESINQKLAKLILKKLTKAQTALLAARSTSVTKKAAKLVGKARKQLDKIEAKANAFVSKPKNAISPECRDLIQAATGRVTEQIAANRI